MNLGRTIHFKDAIKFGFKTYSKHWLLFLKAFLLYFLLAATLMGLFVGIPYVLLSAAFKATHPEYLTVFLGIAVGITFELSSIYFLAHFMKIGLDLYDGKSISIQSFFVLPLNQIFRYFVANLIYGFRILIGLLFFIIPGLYLWAKYTFISYFIIDKNMSIARDHELNDKLTQGVRWPLFWANLVLYVIQMILYLGTITIFLIPIITFTYVYIFRTLQKTQTIDEVKESLLKK